MINRYIHINLVYCNHDVYISVNHDMYISVNHVPEYHDMYISVNHDMYISVNHVPEYIHHRYRTITIPGYVPDCSS